MTDTVARVRESRSTSGPDTSGPDTSGWDTSGPGTSGHSATARVRPRLAALVAVVVLVLAAFVLLPAAPSTAAAGGSTLTTDQRLRPGQSISSGDYRLVMQGDGNLVMYTQGWRVRWHSRSDGNPGASAVMQGDGNFVVYDTAGRALWHSFTYGHPGSRVVIQGDGNLVVYRGDNYPLWNIGVDVREADPSGLYAIRGGLAVGSCGDPVGFARSMAEQRRIYHGGTGWSGQIVAYGSDSASLVQAWRNSPPHATLAADRSWSRMQAGAARGTDGRLYGVVNFCR